MAITFWTQRYESDGRLCGPPITRLLTRGAATVSLVRYELGYGGRATNVTDTSITIRTPLPGRYDVTTFSGSSEEMIYLLRALAFWTEAEQKFSQQRRGWIVDQAKVAGLDRAMDLMMLPIVLSVGYTLGTLCAMAGCTPEQTHNIREMRLKDEVLDPILELAIDGSPIEECLSLAA